VNHLAPLFAYDGEGNGRIDRGDLIKVLMTNLHTHVKLRVITPQEAKALAEYYADKIIALGDEDSDGSMDMLAMGKYLKGAVKIERQLREKVEEIREKQIKSGKAIRSQTREKVKIERRAMDMVALLSAVCCPLAAGCWLLTAGCWLLAAGCWLLAAGCWLLAAGCWLLAAGCWLLAAGRWLLAAGCWLLAADCYIAI
jgi:hypothetical protein